VDGGALTGAAPNGVVLAPVAQIVFGSQGRIVGNPPLVFSAGGFNVSVEAVSGLVTVQ
jgi:hypothetical protein